MALRQRNRYALRRRPKGAAASFGLAVLVTMLPARTGYQDIAALVARQSAGGESFRAHLIASPFGTIHAATFHLPQPVGTGIPPSAVHLAAYDPAGDVTGAISRALLTPTDHQRVRITTFRRSTAP